MFGRFPLVLTFLYLLLANKAENNYFIHENHNNPERKIVIMTRLAIQSPPELGNCPILHKTSTTAIMHMWETSNQIQLMIEAKVLNTVTTMLSNGTEMNNYY